MIVGILVVSGEKVVKALFVGGDLGSYMIGFALMTAVAILGAIRNTMEEVLVKDEDYDSNFVVGVESIMSAAFTAAIGVVMMVFSGGDWNGITPAIESGINTGGVVICMVLFLICIYGKDTMQMKVTKLSSSMTRKLFQAFYPLGTWALSVVTFWASGSPTTERHLGEELRWTSFIRGFGFCIVFLGMGFYMKPPDCCDKKKDMKDAPLMSMQPAEGSINDFSSTVSDNKIAL